MACALRDSVDGIIQDATNLESALGKIRVLVDQKYGAPPRILSRRAALALADLLRRRLRDTDDIGLIGGGRFGIAMESTDEKNATALFSRLHDEHGGAFRYVIEPRADCQTAEEWIRRASVALIRPRPGAPRLLPRGEGTASPTAAAE